MHPIFVVLICPPTLSQFAILFFLELMNNICEIINLGCGERSLSAKTFFQIITTAVTQVDLNAKPLFDFFKNVFSNIRYVHQVKRLNE